MSLRHLYIDLNILGVYPDLIEDKSGKVDIVKFSADRLLKGVIIDNKYYGYRIYFFEDTRYLFISRKMYISDQNNMFVRFIETDNIIWINIKNNHHKFLISITNWKSYINWIGHEIRNVNLHKINIERMYNIFYDIDTIHDIDSLEHLLKSHDTS